MSVVKEAAAMTEDEQRRAAFAVLNGDANIGDDLIFPLEQAVTILEYIIQDLQEDYFDAVEADKENREFYIVWEFNRAAAKAEILAEYIRKTRAALNELYALKEKRGEEMSNDKEQAATTANTEPERLPNLWKLAQRLVEHGGNRKTVEKIAKVLDVVSVDSFEKMKTETEHLQSIS